ncbi:MAG: DUF4037 domain-containing protein [Sphaerochaeta sp.]|nr:DUF4037 domain-containing protein [Sphaerochaeta sp.]
MIQALIEELKAQKGLDALVLAGSRTGLGSDTLSDWDLYLYAEKTLSLEIRREIARRYAAKAEVGNDFFGEGDELLLKDGTYADLTYRSLSWAEDEVRRVWIDCQAQVGYTTAFIHNLKTSKILFDPYHRFADLQERLSSPYPTALVQAIIAKNHPLLRSKLTASYYEQIEHALERNDLISVAHRSSALLASYFDVLFALNRQTHPGEKRLVAWATHTCSQLPCNFVQDVRAVVQGIGQADILERLTVLLDHLDDLMDL